RHLDFLALRIEQMDVAIRFPLAHGGGEVQVKLELVFRQLVSRRIDVLHNGRGLYDWFGLIKLGDNRFAAIRAGQPRWIKRRLIAHAAHQRKARLETENTILETI